MRRTSMLEARVRSQAGELRGLEVSLQVLSVHVCRTVCRIELVKENSDCRSF